MADCFAGGENLNRWMVREGWAVAYRQYSTAYVAAEEHARTGQRGIWEGRFDMPWDWRAARRSGQSGTADAEVATTRRAKLVLQPAPDLLSDRQLRRGALVSAELPLGRQARPRQ